MIWICETKVLKTESTWNMLSDDDAYWNSNLIHNYYTQICKWYFLVGKQLGSFEWTVSIRIEFNLEGMLKMI